MNNQPGTTGTIERTQTDQKASLEANRQFQEKFLSRNKGYRKSPFSEALLYQAIIMQKATNPNVSGQTLAALIRAWDVLEERKRILRNRPLPGQLRPDLDPVQLAKAAKRAKARLPHDIGSTIEAEEAAHEGGEEPQDCEGGEGKPQDSEPTA